MQVSAIKKLVLNLDHSGEIHKITENIILRARFGVAPKQSESQLNQHSSRQDLLIAQYRRQLWAWLHGAEGQRIIFVKPESKAPTEIKKVPKRIKEKGIWTQG